MSLSVVITRPSKVLSGPTLSFTILLWLINDRLGLCKQIIANAQFLIDFFLFDDSFKLWPIHCRSFT